MPNRWTPEDYEFIRQSRYPENQKGFLEDLDAGHFLRREPTIIVCCSDFFRSHDMTQWMARLRGFLPAENPLMHRLQWHGGMIRLIYGSPTNDELPSSDQVFLREIRRAVELTRITDIVGIGHWPCMEVLNHDMGVADVVDDLLAARERLKREIGHRALQVRPVLHVDYGNELPPSGMRSYYVSPRRYAENCAA